MEKHIVIISEQLIPNFIPLYLNKEKINFVYIIATSQMKKKYEIFAQICSTYNWKCQKIEVSSYNYPEIIEKLNKHIPQEENLHFNLTGGTKMMTISAYEFCQKRKIRSLYVDTANQKILQITPEFKETPLPDILDLENYLSLYGYKIKSKETKKPEKKFLASIPELLNIVCKNKKFFSILNYLSSQANNSNNKVMIKKNSTYIKKQLSFLQERKMLNINKDTIIFTGEKERFFCNGGWLEDYVFTCLLELKEEIGIKDLAKNIKVVDLEENKNELDIAFCIKNKLYIIECKTTKKTDFESSKKPLKTDVDYLYKLESIKNKVAGIYGYPIFIGLHTSDNLIQRARSWGIRIISDKKLKNLKEEIKKLL